MAKTKYEYEVAAFMSQKIGIELPEGLTNPTEKTKLHRLRMMTEELGELAGAIHDDDLVGVADGLGDLLYVVVGTFLEYGMPLDAVFDEVHRSNMTKGVCNENGKGGKGPTFSPPRLAEVIGNVVR